MLNDVYSYIKREETNYQKPIQLEDGWDWGMRDHLRRSFLYKNSQFEEDNLNRDLRPNKNIILAILNVEYRTEGFDVKDIELYVDNPDEYYKSFLVKKFHTKWALENEMDTFIDEVVESYTDYGGALVRNTNKNRPEVVDLRTMAFCNQTNLLDYPFCIKHSFSPAQLRKMDKWGQDAYGATISLDNLITLCKDEKSIEVYELHGMLPSEWLNDNMREGEIFDTNQIQVVAFYKDSNRIEYGVTLFKYREPKLPFKFLKRDDIKGRALGRGGIEELFEAQVWTNWNEVKITEMLEAASKNVLLTDDPSFSAKHPSGLKNVTNNEVLEVSPAGKGVWQMDTYPRNIAVFNDAVARWQEHTQILGSASEGLLGDSPSSGTPFKLFEAQNIEAKGIHRYRQGKIATFIDEIYRDWVIPHISKQITTDNSFLAELSGDEMLEVADKVINHHTNRLIVEKILNGEMIDKEEVEAYKQTMKETFYKSNKKFIKILAEDFKDKSLSVMTNIAGKQKNLALLTDKLVNVMRQFLATPQLRQDPEMVRLLNIILESSGMSPIMFGSASPMLMQPQQQPGATTEPLAALSQAQQQPTPIA